MPGLPHAPHPPASKFHPWEVSPKPTSPHLLRSYPVRGGAHGRRLLGWC